MPGPTAVSGFMDTLSALDPSNVSACLVVRYGSALDANDGAFLALVADGEALVLSADDRALSTLNPQLMPALVSAGKVSQLELANPPDLVRKKLFGLFSGGAVISGRYPLTELMTALGSGRQADIHDLERVIDVI